MRAGFLKDDIEVPEKVQIKIEDGIVKVKDLGYGTKVQKAVLPIQGMTSASSSVE